jgi:hypothetical protein
VPDPGIHAGRAHADEHVLLSGRGSRPFPDAQVVHRAVALLDERFHEA